MDSRNIIDHYKYWKVDAIKAALDKNRHPFHVLCSNLGNDFNIASIIRNGNAFLTKQVYIYGRRSYDKRGAVGTYNYEHISFLKEGELDKLPKIPIVAMDNVDRAVSIVDFQWPEGEFIMAFGQEQIGLPNEILDIAEHIVYIPQYGSVRSLNVATAAGIAMYDYTSKMSIK